MYRTCLFCNGDLGANEVLELFPVGRRLAFDPARGRLWVVCRRCERWNLTPIEERWEAIEACEREFSGTKLRVSTDNIGLARLPEGLELVRIGPALRPEIAAWRYGDQFGRRRLRFAAMATLGVAAVGGAVIGGVKFGLVGGIGGWRVFTQMGQWGFRAWSRRSVADLRLDSGRRVKIRREHADNALLRSDAQYGWALLVPLVYQDKPWHTEAENTKQERLHGPDAMRVAARILPLLNGAGAGQRTVRDSVRLLDAEGHPQRLITTVAKGAIRNSRQGQFSDAVGTIAGLPAPQRLALEMAVNEDVERRALEGELVVLEEAWRDAEEIARIADDMFLPEGTTAALERLRRQE